MENKKKIQGACHAAILSLGLICTIVGAVLPAMKEEYAISYSLAGALTSVMQLFSIAALFTLSIMTSLLGEKKMTFLMDFSMGLGMLLLAITGNTVCLIVSFALVGIGKGGMAILNNIMARSSENVSKGVNALHATGSAGSAAAPLIAMLAGASLWKLPVLAVAAYCIISGLFFLRTPLKEEKAEEKKEKHEMPKGADYWLTVAILFFYMAFEASTMNFLIVWVMERNIFSPSIATIMQTVLWVTIICGRFICSHLSERMKHSTILLMLSSVLAFFSVIMINAGSAFSVILSVIGLGFGMSGMFPTGISSVERKYAESPFASSLIILAGSIGGMILPMLVGRIADLEGGMTEGFRLLVPAAILLLFSVILKKLNEKRMNRA